MTPVKLVDPDEMSSEVRNYMDGYGELGWLRLSTLDGCENCKYGNAFFAEKTISVAERYTRFMTTPLRTLSPSGRRPL